MDNKILEFNKSMHSDCFMVSFEKALEQAVSLDIYCPNCNRYCHSIKVCGMISYVSTCKRCKNDIKTVIATVGDKLKYKSEIIEKFNKTSLNI